MTANPEIKGIYVTAGGPFGAAAAVEDAGKAGEVAVISFDFVDEKTIAIEAEARATSRTGVEMEALVAVSAAALTIYDMCKSVDRSMVVERIQLEEKSGGRSGHYVRSSAVPGTEADAPGEPN
jgi:hypothetical protein